MRDDQVMIGIDRDLHIVADDAGPASAGLARRRSTFARVKFLSR